MDIALISTIRTLSSRRISCLYYPLMNVKLNDRIQCFNVYGIFCNLVMNICKIINIYVSFSLYIRILLYTSRRRRGYNNSIPSLGVRTCTGI